jgi:hypothetical protein
MRLRPARWTLLLLLMPSQLAAVQAPALESVREGLALTRLPPILAEGEVRKQLGTGLTTSFLFEATAKGAASGKLRGAARVDVRYELWDEVYIVTRFDASGRATRTSLPSFERLVQWWREARLIVFRPSAAAAARSVAVRLRVIPFSQAEQLDAQRWFSQALSAEKSGSAGAISEAVEDQPESFSQVINLLLATSIGRSALLDVQWNLPLPAGQKP